MRTWTATRFVSAVVVGLFASAGATALAEDSQGGKVEPYYGSFGSEVPIAVPAFHGIEPSVKLIYGSTAPNGFVGVGWLLAGSSYIERAAPGGGVPKYDANDVYVMDGAEMMPCTQLGGTHCTKIQNYHRITYSSGADEWYVWRKDGTKATYEASFVTSSGTMRWALKTLEDTSGNTVTYNYWADSSYDVYLDNIQYNGTTVKFYRELRSDKITYATGVGMAQTRYRLKSIDVTVSGQRARAYELTYSTSGSTYRSVLANVRQFGSDASVDASGNVSGGTSLPAITFEPTTMPKTISWSAGYATPSHFRVNKDEAVWFSSDFNGDGLTDVANFDEDYDDVYVGISNGSYLTWTKWSDGPSLLRVNTGGAKWFVGDVNVDGLSDLLYYDEDIDAVYVGVSTGTSLTWSYWGATPSVARVNGDNTYWFTGDFDADGATDIAFYEQSDGVDDSIYVGLNTGSSFSWSTWSVGPSLLRVNGGAAVWFAIDVDGDHDTDIVYYDEDLDAVWAGVSNGSNSFTWSYFGATPSYARVNGDNTSWHAGDFNGDGRAELAFYEQSDGPDDTIYVSQSTGKSMVWGTTSQAPSYCRVNSGEVKWLSDDYNGDGRTDIAYYDEDMDQVNIALSNGAGFTWAYFGYTPGDARVAGDKVEWFVGDFDGSGHAELAFYTQESPTDRVFMGINQGEVPDLLGSVTNGMGGTTEISYEPSSSWDNTYLPVGMIFQNVGAVTTSDGRGASSTTNYSYEGGLWSNTERRFLGFRKVTAVLDAAGNYTETYYHQHVGCISKPEVTYFRNATGDLYSYSSLIYCEDGHRSDNGQSCGPGSSGAPYTSLLLERWDYECNLDASCRRVVSQFGYDDYGNLTLAKEHGDYDVTGDERTTLQGFYPNTTDYIVGLAAYTNLYEGIGTGGSLAGRKLYYYDGNGSYQTAPTKGLKTKESEWDSETGGYVQWTSSYDQWGNQVSMTDRLGNVLTKTFDSTYHINVVQSCDALGWCSSKTWDPVMGQVTATTDTNGNTTTFEYDALGRPTRRTNPLGGYTDFDYLDWGNPTAQRTRETTYDGTAPPPPEDPPEDPPPSEPTYGATEYPGQSMYEAPALGTGYAWDYNMGHRFKPTVDGRISKLGGSFSGTKTVRLYAYPAGTLLASASVTSSDSFTYTSITPVEVTAGSEYVVAVDLDGSGGAMDGIFVNPNTQGNIEITCAGTYLAASTAMPTNCITYYYGMADVGFEPLTDGGGGSGGGTGDGTPENPGQSMFDGTPTGTDQVWDYNMGYQFTANADGEITQLGGYFNGTKTVRLYEYPSGTMLASTSVSSSNSYSYADINPVSVTAGDKFVVAVDLAGSGGAYDGVYTDGQTFGNITIDCVSMFLASSTSMPTTCNTAYVYYYGMPDVTFVAGGASGGDDPVEAPDIGLWTDVYQDGLGRVWKKTQNGGLTKETIYSDATKRVWKDSFWYAEGETPTYVVYAYDGAGRIVTVTNPDGTYAQRVYDDGFSTHYDALGHQKVEWKDGFGRLTRVQETNGGSTYDTLYAYDPNNNLIETVDALGHTATFAYDSLGRKTEMCDLDSGCWSYDYDDAGNLLGQTDARGKTTTFDYDELNRMVATTNDGGEVTTFHYDESGHGAGVGQLTSISGPSWSESRTYDVEGRVVSSELCVQGMCKTTSQAYDVAGRLDSVTYPGGEVVHYDYDEAGRLASVPGYVDSITYNGRGQITELAYANGTTQSYTYDTDRGWLTDSQVTGPGGTLYQASYDYDAAARVTSMSSTTDSLLNVSYGYDDLNRLTSVSGAQSQSFAYDAIGRMTQNTDVGNYSYGSGAHVHAVTSAAGSTYSYDANGNMTAGGGRSLTWNDDNRLASVTKGGVTTSFVYDAAGSRIAKTDSSGTTRYFGGLVEVEPSGQLVKYISAGGKLIAKKAGSSTTYYHVDRLDSVQLMTDANGSAVREVDFAAYGKTLTDTGIADDHGFGGHRTDESTDLVYMNARYYDATLARFISADSVVPDGTNPQALDRYAFGYNNPVSNKDPSGHAPVAAALIGAIVADCTIGWIGFALVAVGYVTKNPFLMSVGQVMLGYVGGLAHGMGGLGAAVAALTSPISPLDPKVKQIIGWAYTAYGIFKGIQQAKALEENREQLLQAGDSDPIDLKSPDEVMSYAREMAPEAEKFEIVQVDYKWGVHSENWVFAVDNSGGSTYLFKFTGNGNGVGGSLAEWGTDMWDKVEVVDRAFVTEAKLQQIAKSVFKIRGTYGLTFNCHTVSYRVWKTIHGGMFGWFKAAKMLDDHLDFGEASWKAYGGGTAWGNTLGLFRDPIRGQVMRAVLWPVGAARAD